jgi:hypothetical protein
MYADLAQRFQQQGLPLHFVTRAQQLQLATAGLVPRDLAERLAAASLADSSQTQQQQQQLPIGDMRTLLQLHLAALLQQLPARARAAAIAWVLDDDKRLREAAGDTTLSIQQSKTPVQDIQVHSSCREFNSHIGNLGCLPWGKPCCRFGGTDFKSQTGNLQA